MVKFLCKRGSPAAQIINRAINADAAHARWRDTATFVIAGGIFNPVAGTCCINYVTCPGAVSSQINPSSFSLAAGTSMNFQFFLIDGDGSQWDNTWEATWEGSSSVMSVTPATGMGLEAGSAAISANITGILEYQAQFCGAYCPTGGQGTSVSGTVYDASPSISSVTPTTFTVGQATPNVTIQGQNFGTNQPTVTFSLGSAQVTSHTDMKIVVTATANVAGTGNFTVTSTGYNGPNFQSNNGGSAQATSPSVTATSPPVPTISALEQLTPSTNTYINPFAPAVGTLQTTGLYLVIFGSNLSANGGSGPPTICVNHGTNVPNCATDGALNVTGGFHLTSAWAITPGQINIPYYVDSNATTGVYSLKLTTPSASWTSSVKVVPYTEVTIVGWVSGAFTLPTGENMGLANDLNTPLLCETDVAAWAAGVRSDLHSGADTVYANAFLVQITANSTPHS